MYKSILPVVFIGLFLIGCGTEPLKPVSVEIPAQKVDYLKEVKPILDNRCVVCHSCYNSPCQLKLSSFEGLDRGSSKEKVYLGERLKAQDPSRLFIDAQTTQQWREKGFTSVINSDSETNTNNSLMLLLLDLFLHQWYFYLILLALHLEQTWRTLLNRHALRSFQYF